MAEAIIKTKITADSDQLRRELEASKQAIDGLRRENDKLHNALGASEGQIKGLRSELSNFSAAGADLQGQLAGITQGAGGLSGQFAGLLSGAGALAAGFMTLQTAGEAIRNTIASTQATGDAFAVMMEGAKGATDHFFQSIASGDWSNLISGMSRAVELAQEYARAADSAGDAAAALGVINSETAAVLAENKAVIASSKSTPEQKREALSNINKHEERVIKVSEHAEQEFTKALTAFFDKVADVSQTASSPFKTIKGSNDKINSGYSDIRLDKKSTLSDVRDYFLVYGIGGSSELHAYTAEKQRLTAKGKETTHVYRGGRDYDLKYTNEALKAQEEYKNLVKRNPHLERMLQILNGITDGGEDGEREQIEAKYKELQAARAARASLQLQRVKQEERLSADEEAARKASAASASKATRDAAKNQIYPEGTIARAEQDLKALQDKLTKATSTTMRALLRDQIKELQDIIAEMQTGQARGANKARRLLAINALEGDEPGSAQETWHGGIYSAVQKRKTPIKLSTEAPKGLDPSKMRKIKSPYDLYIKGVKEAKEANEALSDSMGLVGDALGTVGNAVGGSAGDMLRWGATLLQTIAKVMPQIAAITAAEGKRTIVSSAASSAFGGPVAVAASVASVMGVLASIPKFERGGVVGGSSYYGDKILARVNSGELIANSDQQRRIWQQMQEGRAEIQTNVNVGGEFRLRGSDLVAVVERATRKHNR